MNNILYEVENRTEDIRVKLNSSNSSQRSVINLYGYCEYLLNLNNKQITEAYLSEFVFRYSDHLNNYEPYCIPPSVTQLILQQVQDIACFFPNSEIANSLLDSSELLTKRLNKLNRILTGEVHSEDLINKICFPLVEENNGDASPISTGLLETLTIKISTSKDENKFLIIPSEIKIESNLKTQIDNSWQASIDLLKHYVKKIEPYHEVIIHFDKRVGLYRGNSLGAALTIAFIEELLSYYNSPVIIENNPGIALTGGLKQNGELIEISKEIIEQKVEHVFFSPAQIFIVPVSDKKSAEEKLKILNKDFPGRNLEIIGIETLDELLDSRRLVDISKQKIIVRAGKFAKKNWVSLSVVFILTAVISFFILRDIDTNPHSFRVDGAFLYAVNKNGKVLWEKKAVTSKSQIEDPLLLKGQVKIVDIDSDGRNELLTTIEELVNAKPDSEYSKITCYDSNGESLWSYSFKDKVTSKRTRLPSFYATNIIDTVTISGRKNLVLFANNSPSFSSAIYRLDLKTGKRLPGTFWCSGHTVNGILKDINKDGKKDILCVGHDNGYEDAVSFGFEIDTATKVRPTTDEYLICGFPVADMITYIRYPKTDYDIYKNFRTPGISPTSFIDITSQKFYRFITVDFLNDNSSCLWYQIDYNLKDVNVLVDSRYRVMRDSLVAHGELPLPYTDTPEYVNLQKSKILYWEDVKWVKRNELE